MIPELPVEKVDQLDMRIEADNPRGIGHEVRQHVDVVEDGAAVAIIDHVFHAADIVVHDMGREDIAFTLLSFRFAPANSIAIKRFSPFS